MALREVLAELDVRVRGAEGLERVNARMERFTHAIQTVPTAALQQNMQRVDRGLQQGAVSAGGLGSAVRGVGGAFLAIGAAAAVLERALSGVTDLISDVIELGDEIGDTSERLGVSAQALQEWRYVAERCGLSAEALDRSIGTLNRNTAAAARGGGAAADAFRELDVSLRDANGELRPTEDVLRDTLLALSHIRNPTERAGIAMRIFGRQGAGMAVIAGRGADAIEELLERQRELGGGLGSDVVESAGAADDALIDFRLAMTSLKGVLATDVLPALTWIVNGVGTLVGWFVDLTRTTSILETALGVLGVALAVLAWVSIPVSLPLLILGVALAALVIAIEDVVTAFRGGDSVFGTFVEDVLEAMGVTMTFEGLLESFGAAWDEAMAEASEGIATLLESLASLQHAIGLDVLGEMPSRTVNARTGANGSRAELTERDRRATVAAPPSAIVERRGARARRTHAAGRVEMPTTIHIHGAQDSSAVGREVDRHLRRRIREAAAAQPVAPEEDE